MSLKTNIMRIHADAKCLCYQAHFNNQLSEQDILEVEFYVESLDNNLIYSHPHIYANQRINVDMLEVLLSRGDSVLMKLELIS